MFYTIYKVTNKINGKIYIGKHQTQDLNDGYMGSGKLIRAAIEKYGIENFEKEILFQFDNEAEMNAKEAELVTEEFVNEDMNYNLCPGGKGGWGFNNTEEGQKLREFSYSRWSKAGAAAFKYKFENDEKFKEQHKKHIKKASKKGVESRKIKYPNGVFYNKKHSDQAKEKIGKANSEHQKGESNSQYGTMWITNGLENKKIKKNSIIPEGWYKGRKIK